MTKVGFIGLGVMGEPMCANVARRSGAAVVGYDLRAEPLQRLAEHGVRAAADVAALVADAEVIFMSLPGGPQLSEVCEQLLPLVRAGQTVVDTSTSPVGLTRELAPRFAALGVDYADAPIARTRQAAIDGTLSIMVGGSAEVFARVQPLLACCGSEVTHCGAVGTGQVVKLMNNMVVTQTVVALAEALAIGRRAGVDGEVLFDTMSKGSSDSFVLRNHGMKSLVPGVFPERAFSTDYMRKDLSYAMQLAQEVGLTLRGAETARQLLEQTSEAGHANVYFPALLNIVDTDG
jgi:3-hydroxyisobutyrate dehydrogenase-like beta-hydroxyacid dehydrogenase